MDNDLIMLFRQLDQITNSDIKMTITRFRIYPDEELYTYTDSLDNILRQIANYESYYYRVTAFGKNTNAQIVTDTHFGVTTSNIGNLRLTEADYVNNYLNHVISEYRRRHGRYHFWHVIHRDNIYLEKMETLSKNTKQGFQAAVEGFLDANRKFEEINDLNIVKGIPGIYFLILDEYNTCYIGQSSDIRKRIMQHWSKKNYFSGTGIDMFKAKDTTRIYVFPMSDNEYNRVDLFEHYLVGDMPSQYKLNVLSGGKPDFLLKNHLPLIPKDNSYDDDGSNENGFIRLLKEYEQWDKRVQQNKNKFVVEQ